MPDGDHQFVNITLAGVRCARVASKAGETAEPWGDEVRLHCIRSDTERMPKDTDLSQAKFFTESRLLQRHVRVQLLSLPNASATPFQAGANATVPPPASIFIGTGQFTSFSMVRSIVSQNPLQCCIRRETLRNTSSQTALDASSTGTLACSPAAAAWSASVQLRRLRRRSALAFMRTPQPPRQTRTAPHSMGVHGNLRRPSSGCGVQIRFPSSTARAGRRGGCS